MLMLWYLFINISPIEGAFLMDQLIKSFIYLFLEESNEEVNN